LSIYACSIWVSALQGAKSVLCAAPDKQTLSDDLTADSASRRERGAIGRRLIGGVRIESEERFVLPRFASDDRCHETTDTYFAYVNTRGKRFPDIMRRS
jgi:hypothetical protein